MGERFTGLGHMTHGAFIQRTGITLQIDELDRIGRFGTGRDGVRAVVAGFTENAAMTGREPEQGIILSVTRLSVTGIAARFIHPGAGIVLDLAHRSMAA